MKNILINQTEFVKKSCGEMEGNAEKIEIFITSSENIIWTFFFLIQHPLTSISILVWVSILLFQQNISNLNIEECMEYFK